MLPVTWATSAAASPDLQGRDGARPRELQPRGRYRNERTYLPSDGNLLELAVERDALGMPRALREFTEGPNEEKLDAHARPTMRAVWTVAGATDTWVAPRSAHTTGTYRMDADPERSVIDP